jgi:type 1 glutamine amidotransferase
MANKKILFLGALGQRFPFHDLDKLGSIVTPVLESAGFDVTESRDLDLLQKENIFTFDGVLISGWGYMTQEQLDGLIDFVSLGKGLAGLHGAADSFRGQRNWAFPNLLGGIFRTHPPDSTPDNERFPTLIEVSDRYHYITRGISDFEIYDEMYIVYSDPRRYHELLHFTFEGEKHPLAWVRRHGKGRVFYLALGHEESTLRNKNFQKILVNGVKWASGLDRPGFNQLFPWLG